MHPDRNDEYLLHVHMGYALQLVQFPMTLHLSDVLQIITTEPVTNCKLAMVQKKLSPSSFFRVHQKHGP